MATTTHESFRQPADPHAKIWRYIDIPKLISFLGDSSLYFCRLSELSDPFEGNVAPHAVAGIDEEYVRTELLCGRTPEAARSYAKVLTAWTRASVMVNCWCMQDCESEALWRIYGHPCGVALQTTYSRLADAVPSAIYMGMVQYIDFESTSPDPGNVFNLAMHKRSFFSHEHEVRLVQQTLPQYTTIGGLQRHQPPPFLTQPVPFSTFEAIHVSPYAPSWFFPVVKDLARRYDCPIPVTWSRMRLEA